MDGLRVIRLLALLLLALLPSLHAQIISETCKVIKLNPDQISYQQFKNTDKNGLNYMYQILIPHNLFLATQSIVIDTDIDFEQVKKANIVLEFKPNDFSKNNYASAISENHVDVDENKNFIAIESKYKKQFGSAELNMNFMSFLMQSNDLKQDLKKKVVSVQLHLYTDVDSNDCGLTNQKPSEDGYSNLEVSISLVHDQYEEIDIEAEDGIMGQVEIKVDWSIGEDHVITYALAKSTAKFYIKEFCKTLGYTRGEKVNNLNSQGLEKTGRYFDIKKSECQEFILHTFLSGRSFNKTLSDNDKKSFCVKTVENPDPLKDPPSF